MAALFTSLGACAPAPDWSGYIIRESVCLGARIDGVTAAGGRYLEALGLHDAPGQDLDCAGAATCGEYLSCRGVDATRTCDPSEWITRCADGAHLERCLGRAGAGWVQTIDCRLDRAGNDRCFETTSSAQCAAAPDCEPEGPRCEGSVGVGCSSGVAVHVDCAAFGRTCVASATSATCVDVVEACSENRCEGGDVLNCDDRLGFNRVSCSRLAGPGATCQLRRASPECVPSAPECEGFEGTCVGDVARYCVSGRWEDFDCGAFRNATCRVAAMSGFFGPELLCEPR